MPFDFQQTNIPEVIHVIPKVFEDERGFFMEVMKSSQFAEAGINDQFVQFNHSRSSGKVLRGLHFQRPPRAQSKLVRAITGSIFDVAVDIRQGSPTFGKWVGRTLSAENKELLYIPKGFAHGFCLLSAEAEVVYYCGEEYSAEHDAGVAWNDPMIGIDWPISDPVLSSKDQGLKLLLDTETGFTY